MANTLFNMLSAEQRNKTVQLMTSAKLLLDFQICIEPDARMNMLSLSLKEHGATRSVTVETDDSNEILVFIRDWNLNMAEFYSSEQFLALVKESENV